MFRNLLRNVRENKVDALEYPCYVLGFIGCFVMTAGLFVCLSLPSGNSIGAVIGFGGWLTGCLCWFPAYYFLPEKVTREYWATREAHLQKSDET